MCVLWRKPKNYFLSYAMTSLSLSASLRWNLNNLWIGNIMKISICAKDNIGNIKITTLIISINFIDREIFASDISVFTSPCMKNLNWHSADFISIRHGTSLVKRNESERHKIQNLKITSLTCQRDTSEFRCLPTRRVNKFHEI